MTFILTSPDKAIMTTLPMHCQALQLPLRYRPKSLCTIRGYAIWWNELDHDGESYPRPPDDAILSHPPCNLLLAHSDRHVLCGTATGLIWECNDTGI